MKRIAIFGSGKGTNAENIIQHFSDSDVARVTLVLSNRKDAGILKRAKEHSIPGMFFSIDELNNGTVLSKLKASAIDLIVLAGFLKKIPADLLSEFPNRVVNIHPALLPDYGGEGMYGMHVHRAVVENEEEETGITIHFVNEDYDEGEVIFQDSVEVDLEDSPEDVAYKVQELEHRHYPSVIEWVVSELDSED
ncbi:phosphoribosylglycinamide formyltransferase [bacterium]|nr:phosphoribosylglycinamide formyltransferase [bacterium]